MAADTRNYGKGGGLLRVVSPEGLIDAEAADAARSVAIQDKISDDKLWYSDLSSYIDNQFERFQRHRDGGDGWTERMLNAMRVFKGQYDATQLAEIRKFGGSEVYARVIATKCRGASSLLRDIYLNTEKPWGLKPTPDPTMPDDVLKDIMQLVNVETATMARAGQQVDPGIIRDRITGLVGAAKKATIKLAKVEAERAEKSLDDILVEGGFYEALAAFLVDLPLFPFACIKGPVVKIVPSVTWVDGKAVLEDKPKMFWNRISPFDIWWTPGVSNIADAEVIEISRVSRADLNQLLGLPGYNEQNIRQVLRDYGQSGYVATSGDSSLSQRAALESRENPHTNSSGLMDLMEYHGYVQGVTLLNYGMTAADGINDPDRDFFIQAFKIGRFVIKCQLSPSLKKRPPYYITSFEKVPGTVVGNALPDILDDIQSVCNASLRSLVNNLSIASGPQVVVNDDRVAENDDGELYPWKRWHVGSDPFGSNNSAEKPVDFFHPQSYAQELMGVYEKFTQIADELSAIPRYITGSERMGGAGRTASGLAMLMGNAAKILQTVAANIDNDVIEPGVSELYDLKMLTDTTGLLRGDESIDVLGVNVAIQRETERQRQMEFLQITANPMDFSIMGPKGRSKVLRKVSNSIGMDGDDIVPPEEDLQPMGGPPGAPPPGGAPGGPAAPGAPPQQALPGQGQGPAPAPPAGPAGPPTNVVG